MPLKPNATSMKMPSSNVPKKIIYWQVDHKKNQKSA